MVAKVLKGGPGSMRVLSQIANVILGNREVLSRSIWVEQTLAPVAGLVSLRMWPESSRGRTAASLEMSPAAARSLAKALVEMADKIDDELSERIAG